MSNNAINIYNKMQSYLRIIRRVGVKIKSIYVFDIDGQ